MKVLALNGSPRKEWNTALLLESALEGATSMGAETELIHLYDLTYKGCTSCFACKRKNGKSYGKCGMRDDLTPVLKKAEEADAFVLGSPVYFGAATGLMRACMERLFFPYYTYTDPPGSLYPRKMRAGVVYTFGAPEEMAEKAGWTASLTLTENFINRALGTARTLYCFDTLQFDDYSQFFAPRFDPAHKIERRRTVFPGDRRKAFGLGRWLTEDK